MVYTFFFSKIDINSYLSFTHFLNHLCTVTVPVKIEISIAETAGDLTLARKIHFRLKNDPGLQKHIIKTIIYTSTTAGLIIALSADFRNRKLWQYGKLKYELFNNDIKSNEFKIFDNMFLIDDELSEFQQTFDIIYRNTKVNYKEMEKFNNVDLKVSDFDVNKFVKEIYFEENISILQIIARTIIENNSTYSFPDELEKSIGKIINDYHIGFITKKEYVLLIVDRIYNSSK